MNDTDIEMAGLEAAANHESQLRRQGICCHGAYRSYNPKWTPHLKPGQAQCSDCKQIFETEDDLHEDRREKLI
jgi:hypothetical protein